MMENVNSPTLHDLMLSFQTKIDTVKDCLLLRSSQDDPDCQEMLGRVHRSLRELEVPLTLLRVEIKVQNQTLDKLKDMTSKVELFTQRVSHAQNNIPEHIPSHTEMPTSAPLPLPTPADNQLPPSATETKLPGSVIKKLYPSGSCSSEPPITVDFLTVEEFNSVPKYLKGRMTYEVINNAVVEFNKALSYKQKILATPRSKRGLKIKNQIVVYKEQEIKASDGFFFIVDSDILTNTRMKLDNAGKNCLTILRHCGRIKEVRGGQLTRYCVCPNDNF